jgi:hypothetical protein
MREIFVPLYGFIRQYEISNFRRIRSLKRQVKLRDKFKRTVSEKYLFTDKGAVGLGKGYGKGGRNLSVTSLMIKSFYCWLDLDDYEVKIHGPGNKAMLDDVELIPKEYAWFD